MGHDACADFLKREVFNLLTGIHIPDPNAEMDLLSEVDEVFSTKDNDLLLATPSEDELKQVLRSTNLLAASGIDGIPSLAYSECWEILKTPLLRMIQSVHNGEHPPTHRGLV